jgi:hypothetical protein
MLCHVKRNGSIREEVEKMKKNKRLVFLFTLLGVLVFLGSYDAHAQFGLGQPQIQQKAEPKILSSAGGRYVFGQISDSEKDKFMLDTQTGRLWQTAESGGVGLFLREVPYRIGEGNYKPVPKDMSESEPKEVEKK